MCPDVGRLSRATELHASDDKHGDGDGNRDRGDIRPMFSSSTSVAHRGVSEWN